MSESKSWKNLYEKHPDIYYLFALAQDKNDNILAAISEKTSWKDKIFLDIGTGAGKYAFKFSSKAKFVYGIDRCSSLLSIAKNRQEEMGIKNIKFLNQDIQEMNFEKEFFDIALSAWAINAPWEDSEEAYQNLGSNIQKIFDAIKKCGWFFLITTPPGELGGEVGKKIFDRKTLKNHYLNKKKFVDYLKNQWCFSCKKTRSDWQFENIEQAALCFEIIYGHDTGNYIRKNNKTVIENYADFLYRQK